MMTLLASNVLSLLTLLVPFSLGHMSMQFPYPRDALDGRYYYPWEQNEPMVPMHPGICHALDKDTTIRSGNSFEAGDIIAIDLYGSAPHAGGHCTFWYSTDDVTFTKIIDIKDCTLADSVQVMLPSTLPTQCQSQCTFAFTWIPRDSQRCEIYMNCADIQVSGALGGESNPISINFQTSFIDDVQDEDYGCERVDDNTHWSEVMGQLKTEYGDNPESGSTGGSDTDSDTDTDTDNGGTVEASEEIDDEVCYLTPSLAINLENEISNTGACGTDSSDTRCDDGFCCSRWGFCGDSDAYCNSQAVADWRVGDCATLRAEANAASKNGGNGAVETVAIVICVLVLIVLGGIIGFITYQRRKSKGKEVTFDHADGVDEEMAIDAETNLNTE